jgi:hypothetical protein
VLTRIGRHVRAFLASLGRSARTALVYQARHDWVHVIDLSPGSGRIGALQCRRCGQVVYPEDRDEIDPPCLPSRHDWRPIEVFQWEYVALSNKLRVPLQCSRCRETALRHGEDVTYGCGGGRVDAPGDHE